MSTVKRQAQQWELSPIDYGENTQLPAWPNTCELFQLKLTRFSAQAASNLTREELPETRGRQRASKQLCSTNNHAAAHVLLFDRSLHLKSFFSSSSSPCIGKKKISVCTHRSTVHCQYASKGWINQIFFELKNRPTGRGNRGTLRTTVQRIMQILHKKWQIEVLMEKSPPTRSYKFTINCFHSLK